jgi:hypothetical protein
VYLKCTYTILSRKYFILYGLRYVLYFKCDTKDMPAKKSQNKKLNYILTKNNKYHILYIK